jgi:hypothetical protein
MIDSYHATTIIILFLIVFGLVCPIIGVIPKIREIISLRYLTLVVWLACMLGVIVNFGELQESIKLAVVISTAIMSGLWILARSIEKWMANGWGFNHDLKASVSKGDAKAELEIKNAECKEDKADNE